MTRRRFLPRGPYPAGLSVAAAVILVGPWLFLNGYWSREVLLVTITTLLASSLNLTFGIAGEFAIGQVAVFAGASYLIGYVSTNLVNDVLLGLVLAIAMGLAFGLVTGVIGLRLGGWSLAMVTVLTVILIPDVVQLFGNSLGGSNGLYGIPPPELFGYVLTNNGLYLVSMVLAIAWFVVMRNIVISPYGRSLMVGKESGLLVASLGISSWRLKMAAYAMSSVPVAIASVIFVSLNGYVGTSSFTLSLTIEVIAAAILGGVSSIYGVIAGATVIQLFTSQTGAVSRYEFIAYGVLLVIAGTLLPGGIAGLLRLVWQQLGRVVGAWRPSRTRQAGVDVRESAPEGRGGANIVELNRLGGEPLEIRGVSKSFAGMRAVSEVTFTARPGEVTGLIGPNGSGKTTMLNLICGFHRIDGGVIQLGEARLDGRSSFQVARSGVARTFQTPIVPKDMTVLETTMSGRWGNNPPPWWSAALRLPGFWRSEDDARREARRCLQVVGLQHLEHQEAAKLPLGTRRMVEMARALAAHPSLLLLDEVASGLDEDEVRMMATVIGRIRAAGCTIVLVEHNFELIQLVSDSVVVLAEGQVIAVGKPEEIEAIEDVRVHYLGPSIEIADLL